MTVLRGQLVEVTASHLDDAGCGVGRVGDTGVRVVDLLPGERAQARIAATSKHHPWAWADIEQRLSPMSNERALPVCPAFRECGGCSWQHLDYPAQLREKHARIVRAFDTAGVVATVGDVAPSPRLTHYRNKGKYVIGTGKGVVLGGYAPRSHRVVSTLGCATVEPVIDRVATELREFLNTCGLPVYDESTRTGILRYLVVRTNAAENVLVGLVTTSEAPADAVAAMAAWIETIPQVTGVTWNQNDSTSGAVLSEFSTPMAGVPYVVEGIAGVPLPVHLDSFFQVNRGQAHTMMGRIAELTGAAPGMRAVDLYCGLGGIGFGLARAGADVIAVERSGDADHAAEVAAGSGLSIRFLRDDASVASEFGDVGNVDIDVVTVNPPRKGLSAAARDRIVGLGASTLAYLSCSPDSLARDIRALAPHYDVESVEAFDLMPGTPQVETLALLRRRS